jgi:GDP-4-dehydro-6-deoxy-D-mannose reductase
VSLRVLVTGAEGFVGRVLCDRLESHGHVVFGCDVAVANPGPRRRVCDITRPENIEAALVSAGPLDAVIHLAAITFVPEAASKPDAVLEVNALGTIRLIAAMKRHAPDARLLFVSTSEVYGPPHSLPVTESHSLDPTNPYAISKAAADATCRFMHASEGLDVVIARPFNHSGAGQSDQFVLSSFAKQIAAAALGQADAVLRTGNLEVARDFSHVDDVVRAYELLIRGGQPGHAYNVCSGSTHTLRHAIEILETISGTMVRIETDPARLRKVDVPEIRGSHAKLTEDTGWAPEKMFHQILSDLYEHWRRTLQAS